MELKFPDLYAPTEPDIWTGREQDPSLGDQYWYQAIRQVDLNVSESGNARAAIIGYACDEGVRRNQGRIGAAGGPDAIRKRLARVAWHHQKTVIDLGNIHCRANHLEDCQDTFSSVVTQLMNQHIFSIGLGGGHDIAYAHFRGMYDWLGKKSVTTRIGIINFDAHFDLRPVKQSANSGTPFYQILTELDQRDTQISYLPIGIQAQSNTKQLFSIAREHSVHWIPLETCRLQNQEVQNELAIFLNRVDYIYITIDLDGFSASFAPGVSASSPFGLSPNFVVQILRYLLQSKKVLGVDLAEMNPAFDQDDRTAKLAAGIIDLIVGCI